MAKKSIRNTKTDTDKIRSLSERTVSNEDAALTTNQGLRINDNQSSLKEGPRGATLLEDFILREKITHFDHERIPERVVHARGSAAHGVFKLTKPLARYTKAKFLTDTSRETPVFVRFSTVAGGAGSTDMARDVRGFAVKFYTTEGNYDLVGNNIPVFFIQDAMKFPDLVHAVKPEPNSGMPQAASAHDTFWDFISLMPESLHMIMWAMSDRALPRSLRMMEGFGVHTFRLINEKDEVTFVKFHWKPLLGVHSVAWDEATRISGKDPDFHRRDLWEAIEKGAYPQWDLGVQLIPEQDEFKFKFDLLDPTKLIPEELVPVEIIGRMTLNRNPDNFFAETEQVAFHPGHLVPGIDFSNDPLLQGRLFSYTDTQLSRLGSPNFHEIPINQSVPQVHNNQRDGHMRQAISRGQVSYEPNTLAGGCPYQSMISDGGFAGLGQRKEQYKTRARSESFVDHYSQARMFFRSQTVPERRHIVDAFIFELSKVNVPAIRERVVGLLAHVEADLAREIGAGFGIKPSKIKTPNRSIPADEDENGLQSQEAVDEELVSPALSMARFAGEGLETRKVAFLIADGVMASSVSKMKEILAKQGAFVEFVAPSMAHVVTDEKTVIVPDHFIRGTASVCFDAVFVPAGKKSVDNMLKADPAFIQFINEAYKHCKAVAFSKNTDPLYDRTNLKGREHEDPGVILEEGKDFFNLFIRAISNHRFWDLEVARNNPA